MACLLAQATCHFSAVRIPALQLLLGEFHNYRTATRMREREKKRPFFQRHIPPSLACSVADPGCLSRIPDPDFYPSRIPDPGSKNSNKRER